MPGGYKNIKPEDCTNGFDKRPQDAGYPKGRKNDATLLRELLASRNLKYDNPKLYLMNGILDIIQNTKVKDETKLNAVIKLWQQVYGMPKQEVDSTVTTSQPIIVVKDEKEKKVLEEIVED